MQRGIKQFAGDVTGERSASPVGPFFARSETDDEQLSIQATKGWNRQGMPIGVTSADVGKMLSQARAGRAGDGIIEVRHGAGC